MSRIKIIILICIIIISLSIGMNEYEEFNTMGYVSASTLKIQGKKCKYDSDCISKLCIKDAANIFTCSD